MKYIKKFESVESVEFVSERPLDDSYIIEDIKEILLEIYDLGYENLRIWVNDVRLRDKEKKKKIEKIEIEISKDYSENTIIKKEESDDILMIIDRIIYYLNIYNFDTKVIGYIYNIEENTYNEFNLDMSNKLDLSKFNFIHIKSKINK